LVATYRAGKLVMVRDEGDHFNTHYRTFQSPMKCAQSAFACVRVGTANTPLQAVRTPALTIDMNIPRTTGIMAYDDYQLSGRSGRGLGVRICVLRYAYCQVHRRRIYKGFDVLRL
jgi:hypothetical protein